MNFLSKKIAFIGLAIIGLTTNTIAQNVNGTNFLGQNRVITTAVPFLAITPDTRAGGMGDCGAATSPDANSLHWNAAKYAFVDKDKPYGLSISYTPWLRTLVPDISLSYLSGYYRIDKLSTAAFAMRYFSLGDIQFTDNQGNELRSYRPNEFSFDGAYARKLSDNFSIAVAGRFIYSDLSGKLTVGGTTQTKPAIGFGGDISGYYTKKNVKAGDYKADWAIGFNISNLGPKVTYTNETQRDFIPMNLKIGGSYTLKIDQYNEITAALDLNKLMVPTNPVYQHDSAGNIVKNPDGTNKVQFGYNPKTSVIQGLFQSFYDAPNGFSEELKEINPSLGFEYWYDKQFAGRLGYFYESPSKGNRQFLTIGLGVKYTVFQFDFAYLVATNTQSTTTRNPLDQTLRFSLQFYFNKAKGGGIDTQGAE